MTSGKWVRHKHGYGHVCSICGYHGKTITGRKVHDRKGCKSHFESVSQEIFK